MVPELFLSAAMMVSPALPPSLFAHPVEVDKLDNGLTVVTLPYDSPGIVSYFTLVRAGARDEVEPGKSGYAHLFEHLMFRGTAKTSAAEYERQMQALGADNNAFTTNDFTLYVPTVPKEGLGELVKLDADRFMHLQYAQAAYKDETGAVLGEYNKTASNPGLPMEEALRAMAFTAHSYGHTTLGWKHDVEVMPQAFDYSLGFFRRYYTPDDCTIFVVGDVDRASVLALVKGAYQGWTGKRAATATKTEPDQTAPRAKALTWKGPTLPRLLEGFKIPAASASMVDTAALEVVATLAFGTSSELYQRLVVSDPKLVSLACDPDDAVNRDPGLFMVEAKLKSTTGFDEVVSAIDAALAKVGRGEVPPDKVEAARSHVHNALVLSLQTPQAIGTTLARWTAVTGDAHGLEAFEKALLGVTPDDVARVARTFLVPARRSVVTLTGGGSK